MKWKTVIIVAHIDKGTGKVTETTKYDAQKVELVIKDERDKRRKHALIRNFRKHDRRGNFIIARTTNILTLDLTVKDRGYFLQLLPFTSFNENVLKKNGKCMTLKQIARIWGVHQDVAKKRLRKYVKLKLLVSNPHPDNARKHIYALGNDYFIMGKLKKKERYNLVKIYKKNLRTLVERLKEIEINEIEKEKVDATTALGFLFSLLPFVHYDTYFLVENKNEMLKFNEKEKMLLLKQSNKALKYLTKTGIGKCSGYKRMNLQTINKYMNYLEEAGALISQKTGRQTRYILNPNIFYRKDNQGTDEYTKKVLESFKERHPGGENNQLFKETTLSDLTGWAGYYI